MCPLTPTLTLARPLTPNTLGHTRIHVQGMSALHIAAAVGAIQVMIELLAHGYDVNCPDKVRTGRWWRSA